MLAHLQEDSQKELAKRLADKAQGTSTKHVQTNAATVCIHVNMWNMYADLPQNLIAYVGCECLFLDNSALLTGSDCFYCFRPNKSSS
jgi:hypothetical protein